LDPLVTQSLDQLGGFNQKRIHPEGYWGLLFEGVKEGLIIRNQVRVFLEGFVRAAYWGPELSVH
jgi:hypothetical protein